MSADSFFERWSRRNAEAAAEKRAAPTMQPADMQPADTPSGAVLPAAEPPKPPTLEDVERLTHDADFTPFMARGVDENIKRSAMKKLFTDPHFNVMDGLDVYIEDYHTFVPLPAHMLAKLNHAQALLDPLGQLKQPLMRLIDAIAEEDRSAPKPALDTEAAQEAPQETLQAQQDTDHRGDTPPTETSDDDPV
jgi:hypothetical protein